MRMYSVFSKNGYYIRYVATTCSLVSSIHNVDYIYYGYAF
jgi:hypothetical protein